MFLQKYKKLDNLCKELLHSEKGVSSYIENMEQCEYSRKIAGWEKDYRNLKKYRHMRNRIVHENNVDEETLCSAADEIWIEQFYERIIHCEDPLALHRKYIMSSCQYSKGKKGQADQNMPLLEGERNIVKKPDSFPYIIDVLFGLIIIVGLIVIIELIIYLK